MFTKYPLTLIGNGQPIVLPRATQQPDYEAELAVVIGKAGRDIPEADWEEYVFGYTILNDVSARDVQLATSQWTLGKNFPTFGPMGPWIVSKDEVPDPHATGYFALHQWRDPAEFQYAGVDFQAA